MRDSQRLETLSSTAAIGLWADDVILALDRVTRLGERDDADIELLKEAAAILQAALRRTEEPLRKAANSGRSLAATDTALDIATTLGADEGVGDTATLLREMSSTLEAVAAKPVDADDPAAKPVAADDPRLQPVIRFFSAVGEQQLVESNAVLGARKDARAWTTPPGILSSF